MLSYVFVSLQLSSLLNITLKCAQRANKCLVYLVKRNEIGSPSVLLSKRTMRGPARPLEINLKALYQGNWLLGKGERMSEEANKKKGKDLGTVLEEETHSLSQVVCQVGTQVPPVHLAIHVSLSGGKKTLVTLKFQSFIKMGI